MKSKIKAWTNVLITSAGFEDMDGKPKVNIINSFRKMLDKPISDAKVLFIPIAAINDEAKLMVDKCKSELIHIGILPENIITYQVDGSISESDAMTYDVIYFTGGDTGYLLKQIKETGFDMITKKMVFANKVYVGVSAGSLIATPNIDQPYSESTAGLCLINAFLSVHCPENTAPITDLPLPHIALTDKQALAVTYRGYKLIEG
jgi:peptidase E